jgi:hypothetical protein
MEGETGMRSKEGGEDLFDGKRSGGKHGVFGSRFVEAVAVALEAGEGHVEDQV